MFKTLISEVRIAFEAMRPVRIPPPIPNAAPKPPKTFLPGVHDPSSPARPGAQRKLALLKKASQGRPQPKPPGMESVISFYRTVISEGLAAALEACGCGGRDDVEEGGGSRASKPMRQAATYGALRGQMTRDQSVLRNRVMGKGPGVKQAVAGMAKTGVRHPDAMSKRADRMMMQGMGGVQRRPLPSKPAMLRPVNVLKRRG